MLVDNISPEVLQTQNEFYRNIQGIKGKYKEEFSGKKGGINQI